MRQYLDLLQHIRDHGTKHEDRTGTGTIRVFGYQFRVDLNEGFPLLTTKKLAFRWIAEELFWMLRGSTNEHELRDRGVDIWKEWATEEQCDEFGRPEGQLGPVYGHVWRNFGATPEMCPVTDVESTYEYNDDGVDQIADILELLINNPNSRRIILSGWDPREATNVALPPCHTLTQFSVEPGGSCELHKGTGRQEACNSCLRVGGRGKLSAQMYQRSSDVFLGVPYNIASYALLTHMLAHVCELGVGEFIHTFGDVHIYLNHLDQVEEQLTREPRELPSLAIMTECKPEYVSPVDRLLAIEYDDLMLQGYDPHPTIKAEVSV
jgi:thymidylate synthase